MCIVYVEGNKRESINRSPYYVHVMCVEMCMSTSNKILMLMFLFCSFLVGFFIGSI